MDHQGDRRAGVNTLARRSDGWSEVKSCDEYAMEQNSSKPVHHGRFSVSRIRGHPETVIVDEQACIAHQ